ncbi:TlpA family protein disulfide reductase [Rhodobium gokarnense]|uniref:Thiol-disulfide isomerase/thioredoxin n=1 Tax=Rhodobium gokarnense TaxID=364296 RepID=A0ABT3H814_9HYPH|nr:TlpA disulfide reductase family protein [Rhodobium gokarnense]MCW2306479.1 thiol-disulfide isomerase/thioredoxin [Rhodobium gokarnense]
MSATHPGPLSTPSTGVLLRLVIVAAILALTLTVALAERLAGPLDRLKTADPRTPVADLVLETGEGGTTRFSDFRGKLLVVNVWATWCAPCRKEMPALARLHGFLEGEDVEVLPVAVDREGVAAAKQFFAANDIAGLPLLAAPAKEVVAAFGEDRLPYTVLIDRKGREFARLVGPAAWDDTEFAILIRTMARSADE